MSHISRDSFKNYICIVNVEIYFDVKLTYNSAQIDNFCCILDNVMSDLLGFIWFNMSSHTIKTNEISH